MLSRAIEETLRQIVANAGEDAAVVLAKVKEGKGTFGYNAGTGDCGDMLEMGILDPTKVTCLALQRAARIGDGWFSANSDPATLKQMVDEMNGYRREFGTLNHADLRVHTFNQFAQAADGFKQLRDMGATGLYAVGWNPFDENVTTQAKIDGIRRFGDEVIAEV